MSTLVALAMEPEWPATTQPGTVVLYKIPTIGRSGQGFLGVSLTSAGLPEGTTMTFSPDYVRFVGRVPKNQTSLLTITCPVLMPTDTYPFTVTATARRQSITITNQFMPVLRDPSTGPVTLAIDRLSDSTVWLRGKGAMGATYWIESTVDLAHPDWTVIGTTTADGNGRFSYFPEIDRNVPHRFFRAVWRPPGAAAGE